MKGRAKRSQKRAKKVMKFRPSLFWDVNPKTIDPDKHARYIIERVLDFGTDKEVHWAWGYYSQTILRSVVHTSRALHPKTRALWKLIVPLKKIQ